MQLAAGVDHIARVDTMATKRAVLNLGAQDRQWRSQPLSPSIMGAGPDPVHLEAAPPHPPSAVSVLVSLAASTGPPSTLESSPVPLSEAFALISSNSKTSKTAP